MYITGSVTSPRVARIAAKFYAAIMVMSARRYSLSRIASANSFGVVMSFVRFARKSVRFTRAVEVNLNVMQKSFSN